MEKNRSRLLDNLELLNDYRLHDTRIIRYDKLGNDVILEFVEGNICRITFKNVRINEDVEPRLAFDLGDAIGYIDEANIEIDSARYGKCDDKNYYFNACLVRIPEECFNYRNLKIIKSGFRSYEEKPMISFIAEKMEVEKFPFSMLSKKYVRSSDNYQNNLLKCIDILDDEVYQLFSSNNNIFIPEKFELNNDLIIHFASKANDYKFVLRLIDAEIVMKDSDIDIKFIMDKIRRNFLSSLFFRIIGYNLDNYEVGFFISDVREVIVKCKNIKVDL